LDPYFGSSLLAYSNPIMDLQDTLNHTLQQQQRLHALLGGRTPVEFAQLLLAERQELYRVHLLQDAILNMLDTGPDFTDMPDGTMLLEEYYMGRDHHGMQLVREAREFFYRENTFAVPSHRLGDFVRDPLPDGKPVDVTQLVQSITVRVYDMDNPAGQKDEEDGRGLHHLSKFTNTTVIKVELQVRGAANGMDLTTQQMIRDISGVVKGLIDQFGDKVWISKESVFNWRRVDIRPYWNSPAADTVENLRQGRDCSFEELMQIQIAAWTDMLPKVLDVHGDLVSLL
jgi:hypothetical protein